MTPQREFFHSLGLDRGVLAAHGARLCASTLLLHDCMERGRGSSCPIRFSAGWQPRLGWLRAQRTTGLFGVRCPGLAIQERAARPGRSRTTGTQSSVLDRLGDADRGPVRRRPSCPSTCRRVASRRVGVRSWPSDHFAAPLAMAGRDEATRGFAPCESCTSGRWSPVACGCRSRRGHTRIHPRKHDAWVVVGRSNRRPCNRARTRDRGVALGRTAPLRLGTPCYFVKPLRAASSSA